MASVTVLGAGLAGCEAAWQLAERGHSVRLVEMKPKKYSKAHRDAGFAELVCSNSLKAARRESAAGLLKAEMRRLGSLLLRGADRYTVPAGGALAVDRDLFSAYATNHIRQHPLISVVNEEAKVVPGDEICIVATGPLTSERLAEDIKQICGREGLSFFDAAAPVVAADSIDMTCCFAASRYDHGEADYINAPMNKDLYDAFAEVLIQAERAPLHDVDTADPKVYEGCMPIEILMQRGRESARFGPMKPVGLTDPVTGRRPWAVVQLRAENKAKTMYNLVGFQTNLKFGEQKRVFGMIPGLKDAEYIRYGVMHRNTYLDSPNLLEASFSFRNRANLFFAGQITGVEGYMESAASGMIAGINAARLLEGKPVIVLPETTMIGALSRYISGYDGKSFQPMGANFGILPPLEVPIRDKKMRYAALAERAMAMLEDFIKKNNI